MDKDFLLVRKMKNGDEAAMEIFVRRYYPVILRYCRYHIAGSSGSMNAEDVAQETFERFFRSLTDYQHQGKAVHYLYVIAGNLCKDFYKKQAGSLTTQYQIPEENPIGSVDVKVDIERALERLPHELKQVIILHYFQGLKLKEIAGILNIGLPLVKYRIKKAKELLAKILAGGEEKL